MALQIEDYLNEYAAKYFVVKQPRKLVWKKHLGAVELTLKVGDVSHDFTVPPFEASILLHFQVMVIFIGLNRPGSLVAFPLPPS